MFSGSDRRDTTSLIERATMRISCVRQIIEAMPQMKAIGTPMDEHDVEEARRGEGVALAEQAAGGHGVGRAPATAQATDRAVAVG